MTKPELLHTRKSLLLMLFSYGTNLDCAYIDSDYLLSPNTKIVQNINSKYFFIHFSMA